MYERGTMAYHKLTRVQEVFGMEHKVPYTSFRAAGVQEHVIIWVYAFPMWPA